MIATTTISPCATWQIPFPEPQQTAVELCCGMGGIGLGLGAVGYRVVKAYDSWPDVAAAAPYFGAMPGWQPESFGGFQAGRCGSRAEIITHPLWDCDPDRFGPQLANACAQAVGAGCDPALVRFKSIFEILRRPF